MKTIRNILIGAALLIVLAFVGIAGLILLKGIKSKPRPIAQVAAPAPAPAQPSYPIVTPHQVQPPVVQAPAVVTPPPQVAIIPPPAPAPLEQPAPEQPAQQPTETTSAVAPIPQGSIQQTYAVTSGDAALDAKVWAALQGQVDATSQTEIKHLVEAGHGQLDAGTVDRLRTLTANVSAPVVAADPAPPVVPNPGQPSAPREQPQIDSRLFREFGKTTGTMKSDERIYNALTGKSHGVLGLTAVGWREDIRRNLAVPGTMTLDQFKKIMHDVNAIEKDNAADAQTQNVFHP